MQQVTRYTQKEHKPLPPEHVLGFLGAFFSLLAAIITLSRNN